MGSVVFTDSYQISNYGYYTQNVRVNFSESYNSTTKKNTITLTSVEMLSDYAAGTSPVYGVVKFNGTAVKTMNGGSNQVNLANSYSVVSGSSGSYIDLNNDATSFTITLAEGSGGYFGAYVKTGTKPYRMFGVGTPANKTATVTAHYIVSYNANSGTGAPASQTKTYDVPLTLTTTKPSKATTTDATYTVTYNYHNGSSNTTATAAKKTAYAFSKWNTKSDGTGTNYSSGGTYSANAAATLYAQYTSSTSTAAVTLPTPTKTGYSFNGWYTAETGGTKVGNGGASYTPTATITLHAQWTALASTIATISSSVATQGNLALTVTRMSSAYYHKATFKIGSTTMATSDAFATSLSYTIPRSWFTSYPNDTSKTVTVSVQTYTTSACTTTVGSPATSSFTMTADAGMKPAPTSGWASFNPYNTGTAAASISGFVKGYSKAQVTFNSAKISMTDAVGATIASYSVTCLGATDNTSPYQTPVLNATSVSATATVIDSRGRSTSWGYTLTVMDYAKPSISGITVFRCNSGGTADTDGMYISVKATASYSLLDGATGTAQNSCTLQAQIAPSGGSYGAATTLTSGTASVLGGGALSPDTSYTVKIIATDALSNSATYYYTVPTRKWAMKFRSSGNGVAFGKAAETDNTFEVSSDWAVKFGQPLPISSGGTGATSAPAANANLHNYNLLEGVQIAYNTDLNTIVTPNIYRTATDSITASLINKPPVTQPFQLAVMYINSDYAVMQHVNEWLTGNEWRRFGYISGGSWTWRAWHKISELFPLSVGSGGTGATDAQTALANLRAYDLSRGGNLIPDNSDLDNYTSLGVYYVPSAASAATMTNGPVTGSGYKLVVEQMGGGASVRQTAYLTSVGTLYRRKDGGAWSAWVLEITSNDFVSGSSGHRYYTKFPDGTLVEYGYVSLDVTSNMSQIASSGVYYGSATLNFLTSFLNADYSISGNVRYSTGYPVPIGFIPTNASSALVYFYDFYARPASSSLYVLRYEAIGRWK